MSSRQNPVVTVGIFFALTVLIYPLGLWLIFRLSSATPLMLTVGVAAILTCLITRTSLHSLGWHWGSWKVQSLGYFLPLGYIAAAYGFIWMSGVGGWYDSAFVLELKDSYNLGAWSDNAIIIFHFLMTATVSFILLLPSVLGEELGWRGLLVPELSRVLSFTGVALVSGAIWAVWHWPLMFLGLYGNDTTPLAYQLVCFSIGIMSMSVIITYLRLKTDSLWPAVIFHMSHNIFLQKFFNPMTSVDTTSVWFLDEFGAVIPAVVLVLAVIYWRKGNTSFGVSKT